MNGVSVLEATSDSQHHAGSSGVMACVHVLPLLRANQASSSSPVQPSSVRMKIRRTAIYIAIYIYIAIIMISLKIYRTLSPDTPHDVQLSPLNIETNIVLNDVTSSVIYS